MDYYQGYEDAMRQRQVRRSTGLIGWLFRIALSIVYGAFIYAPLLLLSYMLVKEMAPLYSDDVFVKIGLTMIVCYLLFSLIYFLKGVLIALRNNKANTWLIVFVLCVLVTSGAQAMLTQDFFQGFFAERSVANYLVWSWLGAGAVGALIYSHYQFLTNVAPRSVFWSYQLGFRLVGRSRTAAVTESQAQRSNSFFQNAPMKVSFKR